MKMKMMPHFLVTPEVIGQCPASQCQLAVYPPDTSAGDLQSNWNSKNKTPLKLNCAFNIYC